MHFFKYSTILEIPFELELSKLELRAPSTSSTIKHTGLHYLVYSWFALNFDCVKWSSDEMAIFILSKIDVPVLSSEALISSGS